MTTDNKHWAALTPLERGAMTAMGVTPEEWARWNEPLPPMDPEQAKRMKRVMIEAWLTHLPKIIEALAVSPSRMSLKMATPATTAPGDLPPVTDGRYR